jgi:hypothetical protein
MPGGDAKPRRVARLKTAADCQEAQLSLGQLSAVT